METIRHEEYMRRKAQEGEATTWSTIRRTTTGMASKRLTPSSRDRRRLRVSPASNGPEVPLALPLQGQAA